MNKYFEEIQKLLSQYDGKSPGCAVVAIHKGDSIFEHVSGFANVEKDILITSTSNFRLASVSKQFTAVGVLVLLQQGKLRLEQKLTDFFPEFPAYGKDISLYHLLTHTSGLKDYEELMNSNTPITDNGVLTLLTREESGYFTPGSKYQYSNGGYCLLKLIIERVSEISFGNFMREHVFGPLEINTTCINEDGLQNIQDRVFGYSYRDGAFIQTDQDMTSTTTGDGGIYSSIRDMAKWDRVFYTDRVLSKEYRDTLFTKHVRTDESDGSSYGFGLFLKKWGEKEIAYHGGESIGFRIGMCTIPADELTVIFLSNRREGDGAETAQKIAEILTNTI